MITLKALNLDLTNDAPYSYLLTNYASGVSSIVVLCGSNFSANDYILIGEFGQDNAEIVKVSTVTTDTLALASSTKFAHAESTKVTIIPYNQIRFYHTTTTTFNTDTPLAAAADIQANNVYSIYEDSAYSTGYGWFVFYNVHTTTYSTYSNYIPYTDFEINSAQKIVASFLKSLNQEENQIISFDDALLWLSEGYSIAQSELNLVNREYKADDAYTLSTTAGTKEYDLPDDTSRLISVWNDTSKAYVNNISINKLDAQNNSNGSTPSYYIRGGKIGFSPDPFGYSFIIRFLTKAVEIVSPTDLIELPDNNYSCLSDYMRFRASTPLGRSDGADFYTLFIKSIERMKNTSVDRDAAVDDWGFGDTANV